MKKRIITMICVLILLVSGCQDNDTASKQEEVEADVIAIKLKNNKIGVNSDNVVVDGTTATIKKAGIYEVSGTLEDGQLRVDVSDNEKVEIILNNATIHNEDSSTIYVVNADTTTITSKKDTENTLSDGSEYTLVGNETEPNATLFSHDDLIIQGAGTLTINANYQDAIASKDDLEIQSTTLNISANDDGIRGKDSLTITDSKITVDAVSDALKTSNDTEEGKGAIEIISGEFQLTTSGNSETSAKGIKAATTITIYDGSFMINSQDDSIHAVDVNILGGNYQITSGDDGIHADNTLIIEDGNITVLESYEGIEASDLQIHGGTIEISAQDDGINAAGGTDTTTSSGRNDDMFSSSSGTLEISGGKIVVNAQGDGIDVNGDAIITGGVTIVYGPTNGGNGALDYDGTFVVDGGELVALGSTDMAMAISTSSQNSLFLNLDTMQNEQTSIAIKNKSGEEVLSITSLNSYQSLVLSNDKLIINETYTVYVNDTEYTSFTISSNITQIGNAGMRGGFPGDGGPRR